MAKERSTQGWSARAALLHPAWWAALALLLLNDHYLKGAGVLSSAVTGKLSDFAGLLMAPVVLAAVLAPRRRWAFALAHVALGSGFTLLKLCPSVAAAWCALGAWLGASWRIVSDATDLVALPMLLLSYWLFGARLHQGAALKAWQRLATTVAGGLGLFGIVATSRAPPRYPVLTPKSVFVPVADELQELDRSTGQKQRRLDCDQDYSYRPQVVDEVLYVSRSRAVKACDLAAGRTLWEKQLDTREVVHADRTRVIVRSEQEAWALAPRSGAVLWRIAAPGSEAFVLSDRLVVQGYDGEQSSFSISDGKPMTRTGTLFLPGFGQGRFGLQTAIWHFPNLDDPGDARGVTLTYESNSCVGNRLKALAYPNGELLWSIPWCAYGDTAVVDDTLFVSFGYDRNGLLTVARAPRTGRVLWQVLLDD